eukprot:4162212-Pyramimonas_sp.AAC.1
MAMGHDDPGSNRGTFDGGNWHDAIGTSTGYDVVSRHAAKQNIVIGFHHVQECGLRVPGGVR